MTPVLLALHVTLICRPEQIGALGGLARGAGCHRSVGKHPPLLYKRVDQGFPRNIRSPFLRITPCAFARPSSRFSAMRRDNRMKRSAAACGQTSLAVCNRQGQHPNADWYVNPQNGRFCCRVHRVGSAKPRTNENIGSALRLPDGSTRSSSRSVLGCSSAPSPITSSRHARLATRRRCRAS
jgi:hypothetical protein